jgi:hypothetical protein
MSTCSKCGHAISEEAHYCSYCGTKIGDIDLNELEKPIRNRLDAIQNHNEVAFKDIFDTDSYTKFDDWPPLSLQNSEKALKNERDAYKVLSNYAYELKDIKTNIYDGTGMATFQIHYTGKIRDRPFDINSRVTIVLRRKDGSWKIVHEHWSRLPQERL